MYRLLIGPEGGDCLLNTKVSISKGVYLATDVRAVVVVLGICMVFRYCNLLCRRFYIFCSDYSLRKGLEFFAGRNLDTLRIPWSAIHQKARRNYCLSSICCGYRIILPELFLTIFVLAKLRHAATLWNPNLGDTFHCSVYFRIRWLAYQERYWWSNRMQDTERDEAHYEANDISGLSN